MDDEPTRNPCELPPLPVAANYPEERTSEINYTADQMRAYAAAAVAREREACAALCDDHASIEGIAQRCAAAIRAR